MRECPNLKVDRYSIRSGSRKIEQWRCIGLIGPRLETLVIYGGATEGNEVLKQCTGLRSLTVNGFGDVTADLTLERIFDT